ncbi:AraC family transcriptional regulator [Flavihumibacter rivuli]|uniref:AraC family transcriptional regulator n=1 Tax=Flavihumibacter rivuli TaxID=2838156 RepID=UPI001BDE83C3|nr:AraC family transcriptional regulator [Flavihumibacter rivuli]ULQ54953.1 AraC family transcriptional regulator [Flavihumibacter rivuli]
MKPLIEKLPLSENTSFVARTYRTPHFEVPWHQHIEYELILFLEGEGTAYIGNHVGSFKTGDVFFLGSNLPHTFQKAAPDLVTAAVVIQFREDFWGKEFLQLPECREIRLLFQRSMQGLKLEQGLCATLSPLIRQLEHASGAQRIGLLFGCLSLLASSDNYESVSTQEAGTFLSRNRERIDKVFQYTIDHYAEEISLQEVAAHIGMSVPAFCHYFRKSTKKTYVAFLNEVRIGKACQLLMDTAKPIADICYETGYNTLANFNKQFLRIKGMTPGNYRKRFAESSISNSVPVMDAHTELRVLTGQD